MNIKPLGNRLVIKLALKKKVSQSGFILSAKDDLEQAIGEVISIGTGYGTEDNIQDLGLKIGNTVLFSKYGGEEIKDETDVTFKILKGSDVIAIIEK